MAWIMMPFCACMRFSAWSKMIDAAAAGWTGPRDPREEVGACLEGRPTQVCGWQDEAPCFPHA